MRTLKSLLLAAGVGAALLSPNSSQAQAWSQDGPPPRFHHAAAYDAVTDQLIVFGGAQGGILPPLNDVWSEPGIVTVGQAKQFGDTWVQVFPSGTAPAARYGHSGMYDSSSNRMIIFGGGTSSTACLNDLWLLDDANSANGTPDWIAVTASGTLPPARLQHSAAYDPTTNSLIVFGGKNCTSGYFSDVWVLSNANGQGGTPSWTQLSPTGPGPAARENSSAIYDPVNNVLTVYAGDEGGNGFSDVWTLANANGQGGVPKWTRLSPTGVAPTARTGHSAVYDAANNRMLVFGGINSANGNRFMSDTWILTNANNLGGTPAWTQLKVTGTAPQRHYHTAFYSPAFNDMIIFAGISQFTVQPAADEMFLLTVADGL